MKCNVNGDGRESTSYQSSPKINNSADKENHQSDTKTNRAPGSAKNFRKILLSRSDGRFGRLKFS